MLKYYGYITEQYFLEKNVKGEIMKKYDYLIVGAGLFGAVFAHEMTKEGKKCLVIDKRDHIAGNIYCENVEGINVHKYGAHIFHTSDKVVWEYINQFAEFNNYINSPVARYKDELYNLPFNMNTFSKMFGIKTPAEAKAKIQEEIEELGITEPKNLEEQALSLAGRSVYEKVIQRNSGDVTVRIFLHLLSRDFHFVLFMIITTLMTVFREFLWEDILRL